MAVELKVPEVGESITEVEIGRWLVGEGEKASKDEALVEIETDKATIELPAPVSGTVTKRLKGEGEAASVGEVIGYMEEGVAAETASPEAREKPQEEVPRRSLEEKEEVQEPEPPSRVMPAAERVLAEHGLEAGAVEATGPGGRLLKEDVERYLEARQPETAVREAPERPPERPERQEEVVRMSPLRRRIAQRLVEAQQTAALLTTFNEVDMSGVMALRKEYQPAFQEKYKIKLGFMSFFVKASVDALKLFPQINAEIRGDAIVYKNYYDIGIAVGSGRGLVVPVLRHAERMSFAEVELAIADFARRAQDNKLKPEELSGGTFTISNGGVYGSMLSTPIVNPPQSGVLGLHAIQERPVARDGQIIIKPMMYVALTYDHRVVDGREAVTFLRRIKEVIEVPTRMLLEV